MQKIKLILSLLLLFQLTTQSHDQSEAHFPLGDDTDIGRFSRTLTHSSNRLTPASDQDNNPNKAYQSTQNGQYLETDLSYITGDFSISLWTKFNGELFYYYQHHTLISVLFSASGQSDLEIINFTNEHISANGDVYAENSKFMLTNEWEFVALERNQGELYFYTSNKGYQKVDFPQESISNYNTQALTLRIGNTFDTQYKEQHGVEYSYLGLFSDLRIYSKPISNYNYIAFADFQGYSLDEIQIAHYPLNKNLKETNSAFPRLSFYPDDDGNEFIQGRSTYDRKNNRLSAISFDNDANVIIPKEIFDGITSFTISLYVNGIDVENNNPDNQVSLIDFYDFANDYYFYAFGSRRYIFDNYTGEYGFPKQVLDGLWNHVIFSVDQSTQQFKFCVNKHCIQQTFTKTDFLQQTTFIALAYLPTVEPNVNPGYLKIDDLRFFNTALTRYQVLDISTLYSAHGTERTFDESYIFRLHNNQYSDIQVFRHPGQQYPVQYNNAEFTETDFNDQKVLAARGHEIHFGYIPNPHMAVPFAISFWVKPINMDNLNNASKLLRINYSEIYFELFLDHLTANGQNYPVQLLMDSLEWTNILVKVHPFEQSITISNFGSINQRIPSISFPATLTEITAVGDHFQFTNVIIYDYIPEDHILNKAHNLFKNNPNNEDRLEEDVATDPVDPPTDPVDPPTDPVDPPTDPVDPPTDPVDPPTDPVDPVDPELECYSLLGNLDASKIQVQFQLLFQNDDYYHKYTVTYGDFKNDASCFDTEIMIGSKKVTTAVHNEDSTYLEFLHLDAHSQGCEKPTQTNTQCKFAIEIKFQGNPQIQRHFTSVVNTPDLNNIAQDLSYGVQIDAYVDDEDSVIDQTLDTQLKPCANPECSSYLDTLELPKGEVAYFEFKILTPGYDQYYITHDSFQLNNINVPLENQSEIETWDQQGRIIYQFRPLTSGASIKLSVKVTLSRTNPHLRRMLDTPESLEQQRENIGNHMYIDVLEVGEIKQKQNLKQNKEEKDDSYTVLYIVIGGAVVLSIVSVSVAVVCYKLKINQKLNKEAKYRKSPSSAQDQSVNQSISIGQSQNNINESRQELA